MNAVLNSVVSHPIRSWQIGYCTNVHAGADWPQTQANLQRYALAVKTQFSPTVPMGVGLWLSAAAARTLLEEHRTAELAAWLGTVGLVPFTLNGFPYGDFHQPVVKHLVYHPTWWEAARRDYTLDLIEILHGLLPAGVSCSISTLPLGWGQPPLTPEQRQAAAENLRQVAVRLHRLEAESGRQITLAIEPEPGCAIQLSEDMVRFFQDDLLGGPGGARVDAPEEARLRRYVGVCHDVCHAAVMFEEQADVLRAYRAAGIRVGKVQVSSAVCARLDALPQATRRAALDQLAAFREPRYLHQTCVRRSAEEKPAFYEDLPAALDAARGGVLSGEWRTHFHVPVFLERFGQLETSQGDILKCLEAARRYSDTTHFEVETYAWNVLPPELRQADLAKGIAEELKWFQTLADSTHGKGGTL